MRRLPNAPAFERSKLVIRNIDGGRRHAAYGVQRLLTATDLRRPIRLPNSRIGRR